jgi:hypothetical protein
MSAGSTEEFTMGAGGSVHPGLLPRTAPSGQTHQAWRDIDGSQERRSARMGAADLGLSVTHNKKIVVRVVAEFRIGSYQ